MADENKPVTEKALEQPIVVVPHCPYCGNQLMGFNVCQMSLPTPQGMMTFIVPVCPHLECGAALAFQYVDTKKAEPGPGLWTPPGRA
jgi:hypothetical protein